MAHFEVYKDSSGQWRWRLVGGNGEIVAVASESYYSAENAERSAAWVKVTAPAAPIRRF